MSFPVYAALFPGQGGALEERWLEALRGWGPLEALVPEVATRDGVHGLSRAKGAALQRALVGLALGAYEGARDAGLPEPAVTLGHSLGELAAASSAGVFAHEAALSIAEARGAAMERCAVAHPGSMAALTGATRESVERALAAARAAGFAALAAHNAPDEWVLAGDHAALRAALGAHAGVRLDVAGPWHTERMQPAAGALSEALARAALVDARVPWVSAVTAAEARSAGEIAGLLSRAVTEPVRFVEALRAVWALGVRTFVVFGAGRAVRMSVRKTLGRAASVHLIDAPEALPEALRGA